VLLAATLLADEAAWLVADPELDVDEAEEVDPAAEEDEADADEDAADEPEPEVDDAADVDDKSTVALDRVTEA
jgi:hypothetical protein